MDTKKCLKTAAKFICELCDFRCCKQSNFNSHINTPKHKKIQNDTKNSLNNADNYYCECGKKYKYHSGLWRHKTKDNCIIDNCIIDNSKNITNTIELTNLVLEVVKNNNEIQKQCIEFQKQNNELQKQMLEVCKNGTNNSITNTINSHNKSFNLNFFLNETCKDAMNIMDFVDSIKIQLSDLEKVGKIGFVEGISNIIVKNLNLLDENKRPVHCTDSKREVMYVKDEDKWEKENETNKKIRKAIKYVAHKNSKMLSEFRTKNPDCLKSTSKVSDKYNKLVYEALGGKGDNDAEKEDKIIKNIAKEVTIDNKA